MCEGRFFFFSLREKPAPLLFFLLPDIQAEQSAEQEKKLKEG
jgi:hypothetical protein